MNCKTCKHAKTWHGAGSCMTYNCECKEFKE